MSTKNDQKVLIRSMNRDTVIKYLIESDLNGKIEANDQNVWNHHEGKDVKYETDGGGTDLKNTLFLINNNTIKNYAYTTIPYNIKKQSTRSDFQPFNKKISNLSTLRLQLPNYNGFINRGFYFPVFRPMFEYKE